MSEFHDRYTVSRLVGAPPGYVGYDEGGQLTEKVRRKPFSVVLFDEIEKAHPDVFNTLLQILEDGRLTDGQGRIVDFKNTVLILTTNLGTRDVAKAVSLGFQAANDADVQLRADEAEGQRRAQAALPAGVPQPHRRHDRLPPADARTRSSQIVDLMIARIEGQLRTRTWASSSPTNAKKLLAKKGFDPVLGARPLRRTIQREIEDALSEKILFGELRPGQIVVVDTTARATSAEVHLPRRAQAGPGPGHAAGGRRRRRSDEERHGLHGRGGTREGPAPSGVPRCRAVAAVGRGPAASEDDRGQARIPGRLRPAADPGRDRGPRHGSRVSAVRMTKFPHACCPDSSRTGRCWWSTPVPSPGRPTRCAGPTRC